MNLNAKALPPNPYDPLSEKKWHDAYAQCLLIQPLTADIIDKNLVYARVLGYLILEAPTHGGRDYVSVEILSCKGDVPKLHDFAELFLSTVEPILDNRCSTPESEYREQVGVFFARPSEDDPQDHTAAKRSALERDSYQCMVTQFYDMDYYLFVLTEEEQEDMAKQLDARIMGTNACHIIPLSPAQDPKLFGPTLNFILNFCSLQWDEFNEATHSLANIMTLNCLIGPFITRLHVWFDPVPGVNNTYDIRSYNRGFLADMPPRVTFSTQTEFPLPDPRYLKIQAAVCQVFQLSGASTRASAKRRLALST